VFAERYTSIAVGEAVSARVNADDPRCAVWPEWPCQYFRLTAPSDGTLDVVMTHSAGNLDLSFTNDAGNTWWYPVSIPVTAGATYQITVWEYETTGVEFELRTSLQPR
jgi:hypothetical protein